MKQLLRYLLVIFIVIVLFIAAGIMLLVNFVNLNDYRDRLGQSISEMVKVPVIIHGDINWQFLPNFGLVLHDITLNTLTKDTHWQAQIKKVCIGVQLLPLLAKHISVSELLLENVNLDLITTTGTLQTNHSAALILSPAALPVKFFTALTQLDLQKLQISDSRVNIHQQLNQVTARLNNIRFEALTMGPNKTAAVQLTFSYLADVQIPHEIHIAYTGQLSTDLIQQQIHCLPCTLSVNGLLANNQHSELRLTSNLLYLLKDQRLTADHIQGSIDGLPFQGQMQVQHLNDQDPEWHFSVSGATDHLAKLITPYGLPLTTQNASAWQHFSFQVTGALLHHQLTLAPVVLQLDHSTLKANIQSSNIENGAFSSQLHLDKIAVQDYVPSAMGLHVANLTAKLTILLPIHQQSFALSGPLSIQSVQMPGMSINDFSTLIDMKGSILSLQQSQANLLGGYYQGTGQVNFNAESPFFTAKQNFTRVQIQPLIHLFDPAFTISGIATINADFTSSGADLKDFKKNLAADVKINVKNGVLYGLNAGQWLNTNQLPNNALPVKTAFGDLKATLLIQNGVISNHDLFLKNPQLCIQGYGTVDLLRQQYHYHLLIKPVKTANGFGGIPLWVTGSFAKPSVQLDTQALVQNLIQKPLASKVLGQEVKHLIPKWDLNKLFSH